MKYRMYVDEVGNSDLGASSDPNHRYLSLSGVIFSLDYVSNVLFPSLEALKTRFFASHPDEPVILHRKELVNQRPPFSALRDPAVRSEFDQAFLELLERLEFVLLTAVIDKQQHCQQYQTWVFDPYHYCLHVLVERYVRFLEDRDRTGDVLAESRGGKEDRRLKLSFEKVWESGTPYVQQARIQERLTSKQLKIKPKANNIAGLQIADLIAHPALRAFIARRDNIPLPDNFGGKIAIILEKMKYRRDGNGRIEGWGRKWLP